MSNSNSASCPNCGDKTTLEPALCDYCQEEDEATEALFRDRLEKAEARVRELETAFDDQSRELRIACEIMTPDQLTEFRQRAYPKIYPCADSPFTSDNE